MGGAIRVPFFRHKIDWECTKYIIFNNNECFNDVLFNFLPKFTLWLQRGSAEIQIQSQVSHRYCKFEDH